MCSLNTQTQTHTSASEFLIAFLQSEFVISSEMNLLVTRYVSIYHDPYSYISVAFLPSGKNSKVVL